MFRVSPTRLRKTVDLISAIRDSLIDVGILHGPGVRADGRQLLPQTSAFEFYGRKPRRIGDDAVIKVDGIRVHVRLLKGSDGKRWLVAR